MFEQAFTATHNLMQASTPMAALGCLLWGIIGVVFSPCHMMTFPIIISYLAGQEEATTTKRGFMYALSFTLGVFITITVAGIACSLLGRMLGEVGPYWTILVGAVLFWVAFDMLRVGRCSMPGRFCRPQMRGIFGAFCLGLAYGVISGSCTFGFLAPILAVISVQQKLMTGILFIVLFGVGYSIPLVIAGCSIAKIKKLFESSSFYTGGLWIRKSAAVVIGCLGLYFVLRPFIPDLQ